MAELRQRVRPAEVSLPQTAHRSAISRPTGNLEATPEPLRSIEHSVAAGPYSAPCEVASSRSPWSHCAAGKTALPHRCARRRLLVQHLVSQIAVVSRWMASLHSLTTRVGRRTVQFPPADHSGRSRLALIPYLIFV